MAHTTQTSKFFPLLMGFSIFFLVFSHSLSFAQDFEHQTSDNVIVSTDINSELMSISYNGNGLEFSLLFKTYINAAYDYEKNGLELGLTNSFLNSYLFDNMKLKIQANPSTGSGSILFVMSL